MHRFATARNALSWVAETAAGAIAGFCIVHLEGESTARSGYVVTLDVHPGLTRKGIATMLLRAAEGEAGRRSASTMRLHVHTENTGALRFYAAGGYHWTERVEDFYGPGVHAEVYEQRLPRM